MENAIDDFMDLFGIFIIFLFLYQAVYQTVEILREKDRNLYKIPCIFGWHLRIKIDKGSWECPDCGCDNNTENDKFGMPEWLYRKLMVFWIILMILSMSLLIILLISLLMSFFYTVSGDIGIRLWYDYGRTG